MPYNWMVVYVREDIKADDFICIHDSILDVHDSQTAVMLLLIVTIREPLHIYGFQLAYCKYSQYANADVTNSPGSDTTSHHAH